MPRLVLVTARFHPHRVTGAIRATQFARLLPEFGWETDVLAFRGTEPLSDTDEGGLGGRNRVRYLDQGQVASSRGQPAVRAIRRLAYAPIRALTVPDSDARRWNRLLGRVVELVDDLGADVVLTTSPPHSVHLAGAAVRTHLGVPWVADFRDPFLGDLRYGGRTALRLRRPAVRSYDNWVHESADGVIHAIPSHHRAERVAHPMEAERFRLIPNGVPEGLVNLDLSRRGLPPPPRLVIAGTAGGRQVVRLAEAISRSIEAGTAVHLSLVGDHDELSKRLADRLGGSFRYLARVSHESAIEAILEGTLLVSVLDRTRARAVLLSSKLFEYGATGSPILAINPTRDDAALLAAHPAAAIAQGDQQRQIDMALEQALGLDPAPESWRRAFVARYRRRSQVKELAEFLGRISQR